MSDGTSRRHLVKEADAAVVVPCVPPGLLDEPKGAGGWEPGVAVHRVRKGDIMTVAQYRNVHIVSRLYDDASVRWSRRGWWVLRRGSTVTRHDSRAYALRLARAYARHGRLALP